MLCEVYFSCKLLISDTFMKMRETTITKTVVSGEKEKLSSEIH